MDSFHFGLLFILSVPDISLNNLKNFDFMMIL